MDKHHVQLRMSHQTKKELREAAKHLNLPESDIVRSALFFGLPIVLTMSDLQEELMKKFVRKLKGEARLRRSRRDAK
jgi:hypothetical protein